MTPDQQKVCADLRRLITDCTMHDVDGKPCLTHDGNVIELALLEIERLAGKSEPMSTQSEGESKTEWAIAFAKHLAHYNVRSDAEESAVVLASALCSAKAENAKIREAIYSATDLDRNIPRTTLELVLPLLDIAKRRDALLSELRTVQKENAETRSDRIIDVLSVHVTAEGIEREKKVFDESCSLEVLVIAAVLRGLSDFCLEAAEDMHADDRSLTAEGWSSRAGIYRECYDACVAAWGGDIVAAQAADGGGAT